MMRRPVNGKRARRAGVVLASMAVLGAAVAPGVAWASNPVAEGTPEAVTSSVSGPAEPGTLAAATCGVAMSNPEAEFRELVEEGLISTFTESDGQLSITTGEPGEAAAVTEGESLPVVAVEGVNADQIAVNFEARTDADGVFTCTVKE